MGVRATTWRLGVYGSGLVCCGWEWDGCEEYWAGFHPVMCRFRWSASVPKCLLLPLCRQFSRCWCRPMSPSRLWCERRLPVRALKRRARRLTCVERSVIRILGELALPGLCRHLRTTPSIRLPSRVTRAACGRLCAG